MTKVLAQSSIEKGSSEIRVRKLSHLLAERLRQQIISGQIQGGEKLPSEAILMSIFKISRPTLREALRILEAENLIKVGRGARSGAMVCAPTIEHVTHYASMLLACSGATLAELHEARSLLEPELVSHLNQHAKTELIQELHACYKEHLKAYQHHDMRWQMLCIRRFHTLIVASASNKVVGTLAGMLFSLGEPSNFLQQLKSKSIQDQFARHLLVTLAAHRRLIRYLEKGNEQAMQRLWKRLLARTRLFLDTSSLGMHNLRFESQSPADFI